MHSECLEHRNGGYYVAGSLRFQADADLRHSIAKAVRQREPGIDFASAADSGLAG
jgi:hypothetical protein